jgi:uncharacterized DUF497 family protein
MKDYDVCLSPLPGIHYLQVGHEQRKTGMIFDWDDANRNHIVRHNVLPEEVEQLFRNRPLFLSSYNRNGEERLNFVGETDQGRVLLVVVMWRNDAFRTVTVWDANKSSRNDYRQWKEAIL